MIVMVFATQQSLRNRSRVPAIARGSTISAAEFVCLLLCGSLAAMAVGFLHLSLRIPGHAILRGMLPMAVGLALVPRRWGGTVMAIGAAVTSSIFSAAYVGSFPASATLSVVALGPALDLALLGQPSGLWLYARFILAGVMANLFALGFKLIGVQLGMQLAGGGEGFARFSFGTLLLSYVLCGALAGLLGACACFRTRGEHDLRRN